MSSSTCKALLEATDASAAVSVTTPAHHASILNINVGLLGHVDSGKTSLSKALSTIASTAAFDKNPQSVERGITLDLGFSSVVCDLLAGAATAHGHGDHAVAESSSQASAAATSSGASESDKTEQLISGSGRSNALSSHENAPDSFAARLPSSVFKRYTRDAGVRTVQLTLVDCPGHASLIRTIIGGASIVDVMILVIDVTKGIQTQTAECIVLGEVLGRRLIIALNKCDLVTVGDVSANSHAAQRALQKAEAKAAKALKKKEKEKEKEGGGKKDKKDAEEEEGTVADAPPATAPAPALVLDEATLREMERRRFIDKVKKRLRKVFHHTKWPHVHFVEVAAAPGSKGEGGGGGDGNEDDEDVDGNGGEGNGKAVEDDLSERIETKKRLAKEDLAKAKKGKKKSKSAAANANAEAGAASAVPPSSANAGASCSSAAPQNVGGLIDAVLMAIDPVALIASRSVTGRAAIANKEKEKTTAEASSAAPILPLDPATMQLLQSAAKKNFLMIVDHCFAVKGHGTVLTGTIAGGCVAVGDEVALPDLQLTRRVKSLQVFHAPVREARQGDRVGLCVAGLDASLFERGIVVSASALSLTAGKGLSGGGGGPTGGGTAESSSSQQQQHSHLQELLMHLLTLQRSQEGGSSLSSLVAVSPAPAFGPPLRLSAAQRLAAAQATTIRANCFIACVRKVRYHQQSLLTGSATGHKYHVTVGHSTEMGTLRYFSVPNPYFTGADRDGNNKKNKATLDGGGDDDKKEKKKSSSSSKGSGGRKEREAMEAAARLRAAVAVEPAAAWAHAQEASLLQLVDLLHSGGVGGGVVGKGGAVNPSLLNTKNIFPFGFDYEDELFGEALSEDEDDEGEGEEEGADTDASKAKKTKKRSEKMTDEDGGGESATTTSSSFIPPLLPSVVAKAPRPRSRVVFAIVQLDNPIVLSTAVSGETLGHLASSGASLLSSSSATSSISSSPLFITRPQTILLASRFDTNLKSTTCRLAVEGTVAAVLADWEGGSGLGSGGAGSSSQQLPTPSVLNTFAGSSSQQQGGGVAQPAPPRAILCGGPSAQSSLLAATDGAHLSTKKATEVTGAAPPQQMSSAAASVTADLLQHFLFTAFRNVHWRSLPIAKPKAKAFPIEKIVDDFTCIVRVPPKPSTQSSDRSTNTNAANSGATTAPAAPSSGKGLAKDGGKGGKGSGGNGNNSNSNAPLKPHEIRDMSVFVRMKVYCTLTATNAAAAAGGGGSPSTSVDGAIHGGAALAPTPVAPTSLTTTIAAWGVVEAPFGQNENKLRVKFSDPIFRRAGQKGGPATAAAASPAMRAAREVVLPYQKYPFAAHSPMAQ